MLKNRFQGFLNRLITTPIIFEDIFGELVLDIYTKKVMHHATNTSNILK